MLGLENDTMIIVKIGDKSIELPCYTMPGQAKYSIGLVLGGGRTAAGHVGGTRGQGAGRLRHLQGPADVGLRHRDEGDRRPRRASATELANVQDHWDIRPGIKKDIGEEAIEKRAPELIREVNHKTFLEHREWTAEEPDSFFEDTNDDGKSGRPRGYSLFEEHEYKAGTAGACRST